MRAKAPHKNGHKEAQEKKHTERQRENRQQAQTYLQKHNNSKHNLAQEKRENKRKQCRQNSQCRIYITTSQRHEKVKETAPQNAQKQQKNTTETKARNKAAKTASLFLLVKMLQARKKQKNNAKRQKKIIPNEICTQDKPQKPQRSSARQNSATRRAKRLPSKSPTGQQKNFGFNFKKKRTNQNF